MGNLVTRFEIAVMVVGVLYLIYLSFTLGMFTKKE